MAYNQVLAERVERYMRKASGFSSRKMFGGVCYMLNGNMACGVVEDKLMLRIGAERAENLLGEDDVSPMDFTGKPMKGMVYVAPKGTACDDNLVRWLAIAKDFAATLPPKQKKGA